MPCSASTGRWRTDDRVSGHSQTGGISRHTGDITKNDAFAEAYVMRLRVRIRALSGFPHVGKRRDTLSPGLRSIRFERAYTIFYVVTESRVEITRILGSRQDHDRILHRRKET